VWRCDWQVRFPSSVVDASMQQHKLVLANGSVGLVLVGAVAPRRIKVMTPSRCTPWHATKVCSVIGLC
jgi:hypothetical protein